LFIPVKFKSDNFHAKLQRSKSFFSISAGQIRFFGAKREGSQNCLPFFEKKMKKQLTFAPVFGMISERSKDSRWRHAVIPAEDASSNLMIFSLRSSLPRSFFERVILFTGGETPKCRTQKS
jgi:hypothetical protein